MVPRKLKDFAEKYGFTLKELPQNVQYEIGKTYWCGYWERCYTVLDVKLAGKNLDSVTVQWQDGTRVVHRTCLNPYQDWELICGKEKKTMNIREVLSRPEYQFIQTNPHLGGSMLFATFGGSHAYGTNKPTSDIDIRGCALNSKRDLLGRTNFEQMIDNETDTTIYAFNKLIGLLENCNPNTIEMLFCRPDSYVFFHPIGKMLIEKRDMFLSQKAVQSFGGYANQQLRRLECAVARDHLSQAKKEEHTLNSMKSSMKHFEEKYTEFDKGSIVLYTAESAREDCDSEIFADIHLNHYPAREFNCIMNELSNVLGTYEKLNHRNHKKDAEHLNKHAMHLIRLYLTCIDLLENGEFSTYRENDIPLLMSIRNGAYQNEDGTYKQEFFDMVSDYERRMNYAKEHTVLPPKPNYKQIEEFVVYVNEEAIRIGG